jgi:hypothetical protein
MLVQPVNNALMAVTCHLTTSTCEYSDQIPLGHANPLNESGRYG